MDLTKINLSFDTISVYTENIPELNKLVQDVALEKIPWINQVAKDFRGDSSCYSVGYGGVMYGQLTRPLSPKSDSVGEVLTICDWVKFFREIYKTFAEVTIPDVTSPDRYSAFIKEKYLLVGCQRVTYPKLKEIYEAAVKAGRIE